MQTHTLCEPARNALGHVFRATLYGNWQGKCQGRGWAQNADMHFVRACAVEISLDMSQEGKMPRPRVSPERGHTFCASLRRQNALGHVTRATLHGNLEGKRQGPDTLLGKICKTTKTLIKPSPKNRFLSWARHLSTVQLPAAQLEASTEQRQKVRLERKTEKGNYTIANYGQKSDIASTTETIKKKYRYIVIDIGDEILIFHEKRI